MNFVLRTKTSELKAIGGSWSKSLCWVFLKDLHEGKQEAFYGMSKLIFVQKLSHFEVRDFGRISYKKQAKLTF